MPDATQFHANAPRGEPLPLTPGLLTVPHATEGAMLPDSAFTSITEDVRDCLLTMIGDEGEFVIDAGRTAEVNNCRISEDAMRRVCAAIGNAPAELGVRDALPPGEALQKRGLPEAA